MQSQSSLRVFDPQQGIDINTQQPRDVHLVNFGIGISKSFAGTRKESIHRINVNHAGSPTITNTREVALVHGLPAPAQHGINTKGTSATNGRFYSSSNVDQ